MISNAFKGAYTNEVAQENKVSGIRQAGIKDAGSAVASIALATIGMNEALVDEGSAAVMSKYGAGRMGGIGGRLVSAIIGEKTMSIKNGSDSKAAINKANAKELGTVYSKMLNNKGDITTQWGDVDPRSPLGQKITDALRKEE